MARRFASKVQQCSIAVGLVWAWTAAVQATPTGCLAEPGPADQHVISQPNAQSGLLMQVLGSGGPVADDRRASSSYLVWQNGRARIMVDAGSGSFTRFGEAGAAFEHLDLIALSHFHTDHAGGLPALLKTGYFSPRTRPLFVAGPAAGGPFPGLDSFLHRLLDRDSGAFGYLSGYLSGTDGLVKLEPVTVPLEADQSTAVFSAADVEVSAMGVPHGIVPAVAYRVQIGGKVAVFGTDQNGSDPRFETFARGADLLVLHVAIPETAGRGARSLHAPPSRLAALAARINPGQLVLSHWMARSLAPQPAIVETIARRYSGPIVAAEDLSCFPL